MMFSHTNSPDFYPAPAPPFSMEQLSAINRFVPYSPDRALSYATELRSEGMDSAKVSAVLTQARLRTRAQAKFGKIADSLLLTDAGYEQASRLAVARLHATRFNNAGLESVADLGCGLGADSFAFAEAGLSVAAVELDETTAALAGHNLSRFEKAQVFCGDIEKIGIEQLSPPGDYPVQALWLDPARREVEAGTTTSRIFEPETFAPPLSFVLALAKTGIPLGIKMAPGIPHSMIPANCEAQWVSHSGSVVEVVLWFNALARPGVTRAATVLDRDPLKPRVLAEFTDSSAQAPLAPVGKLEEFIYEPNGAVVRSHLIGQLATKLGAHVLDEQIAYLSSHRLVSHPAAAAFRVIDTMPLNDKVLRQWAREEEIGTLTIKKRGVNTVPEDLRKRLLAGSKKKRGKKAATLILTRLGSAGNDQRLAIWVEPLTPTT